jgi:hypothetical protein
MTKTKKILTGAAAAVALTVVSLSAGTTSAEAGWKHKHWHFYSYYNPYVYGFYGPAYPSCFVKWTKWGKSYVCY